MPGALPLLLCVVGAYLVGAIPCGLLLARWMCGVNVLEGGSGNIGATNVKRLCGMRVAIAVFFLDTAKGVVAVAVPRLLLPRFLSEQWAPWGVVACGMMAVFGHNWSVFLGWRGGRGVSTSLGMIIGLNPLVAGLAFATWGVVLAATKYVSVASLAGCTAVSVLFAVWRQPVPYQVLAYLGTAMIYYRHRPNMRRLLRGQEPKAWGADKAASKEEPK